MGCTDKWFGGGRRLSSWCIVLVGCVEARADWLSRSLWSSAHARGGEDRADVTADRSLPGLPGRQFGGEGGRSVEGVVRPGDRASRQLRQRVIGQPRDAREDPLDLPVAARGPDQIEVLVEPDRQ